MSVYADSSFIVSLYITDQHSPDSRQRILATSGLWFTALHRAEWVHALAQHVFRGQLAVGDASAIEKQLEEDMAAGVWVETDVPEDGFRVCTELGRRYGSKFGMRTLDTLHVACALELKAKQFWTFDERQSKLAGAVGLRTR